MAQQSPLDIVVVLILETALHAINIVQAPVEDKLDLALRVRGLAHGWKNRG